MISEGKIAGELSNMIFGKIAASFTGKVTKISDAETKGIIEVTHNDLIYPVKIKSVVDEKDKHLLLIPKLNTYAFCASEGNSPERFIALSFNEISKIIYKGENTSFLVDDINKKIEAFIGSISIAMSENEIKFNAAAKNSFMTDINKLVEKVNAIEQSLNALKQVYSTWIPVAQDGGGALKTAVGSWAGQAIALTTVNDLKDEKIKH